MLTQQFNTETWLWPPEKEWRHLKTGHDKPYQNCISIAHFISSTCLRHGLLGENPENLSPTSFFWPNPIHKRSFLNNGQIGLEVILVKSCCHLYGKNFQLYIYNIYISPK
jgi:hypothetical protein